MEDTLGAQFTYTSYSFSLFVLILVLMEDTLADNDIYDTLGTTMS